MAGFREGWTAFRESVWRHLLTVIILGGICGGILTPTEAAAVSAVYAFVIAVRVCKDVTLRDVPRVLLNSAAMSAMLLYIITNAVMFAFILTSEQNPQPRGHFASRFRIHSTSGAATKRHLRRGPAMTLR